MGYRHRDPGERNAWFVQHVSGAAYEAFKGTAKVLPAGFEVDLSPGGSLAAGEYEVRRRRPSGPMTPISNNGEMCV